MGTGSRAAVVTLLAAPPEARAAPSADPWFGRDKALHFGASFGLAVGGYAAASLVFEERPGRIVTAAGIALGAGAAKEVADYFLKGNPSARDLTWDAVGTAMGVLVAWAFD